MTHPTPLSDIEQKTLALVREFVSDLGNERALRAVSLEAILDKDLGFGSLERVELLLRLEQHFAVQLPQNLLFEAETVQQLVTAIQHAEPSRKKALYHERKAVIGEIALIPTTAKTIVEVLQSYGNTEPRRPHIYLQSEQGEEQTITYGQLLEAASALAAGLCDYGLKSGDTVALMLPTSKDFFYAFFGVLFAGGIPVPVYPPLRLDRIEEYARRQAAILQNASITLLITSHKIETLAHLLQPFVPALKAVVTATDLMMCRGNPTSLPCRESDPALIQYTSGSTGNPKGVLLSHANLLSNIRAIGQAIQIRPIDVTVSWLPLYHDMGLIGSWLGSLYFGIPITILSPLTFLTRPERWLWAIHTHRATLSAAPNFAFELCVRKIQDSAIEGLDLSSWRIAFNGSETVSPDTINRFITRFAPYGFHPEALLPVYGLAESSVGLAMPRTGNRARIDKISRQIFASQHRAVPASPEESSPLQFVSCGVPLPDHEIRIVDEKNNETAERREGALQFRGPSVMANYFNAPELTQSIFHEGWWDSGDLAYKAEGEIFITGRRKDLIIKAGRNLYPQELEEIVGDITGIRKGCVAAFGVSDPKLGTEKIVIIAETREHQVSLQEKIAATITERIVAAIGIPPDIVQMAPPGTVPKTSSGKLRRSACREAYLRNELIQKHKPDAWVQMVKLWLSGIIPRSKDMIGKAGKLGYAVYAYFILLMTLLPSGLVLLILPDKSPVISKIARGWARLFLWLMGCFPQLRGNQYLSTIKTTPTILVANHASYLDAIVLLAVLPIEFVFVAKQELLKTPVVGTFIRKQHHLTVDRVNLIKGLLDAEHIEKTLQQGQSILIFPEGTFTRAKGVRPFKLGAFKAAVETASPVCAIAIQGTRHILRSDDWLPQPGAISVTILEPLQPVDKDWHEMTRLRDATRTAIALACDEPLLDL